MSRHRYRAALALGLVTVGVTFVTADAPYQAIGSPVLAIALAGIAAAVTLDRPSRRRPR